MSSVKQFAKLIPKTLILNSFGAIIDFNYRSYFRVNSMLYRELRTITDN